MPPTRPTRSRTATSGPRTRPPRPAGAPRAEHVVDRALAVHALLAAGRTPADVQRRLGKSKGYVSVLGYLGAALAGLEPDDLPRLRVPALTSRVVWPLVTRARTDERTAMKEASGAATIDAARGDARRRIGDHATVQLRAALRAVAQASMVGLTAPPRPRRGRRPRTAAESTGLVFDPAGWAADPVTYARAHLAALAVAHRHLLAAATRAVNAAAAERTVAAQLDTVSGLDAAALPEVSLRRLGRVPAERWRALAASLPQRRSAAEREGLAILHEVAHALDARAPAKWERDDGEED